jgi:hypothetical protein
MKLAWSACLWAVVCIGAADVRAQDAKCPEQNPKPPDGPGIRVAADCTREEGTFRRGRLWGRGKVTTGDGTVYEGDFIEGRLWGQGKVTRAAPDLRWHEGQYYNGIATGPGRRRDETGAIYNGFFHNGAPYGVGVLTFAHGGQLIGEFRPGLGGVGEFVAMLPDGSEHTGAYRPMYGKLSMYRPAEAPAAQAATPPAKAPEPAKSTEPAKAKAEVEKAVDVLRGLLKR